MRPIFDVQAVDETLFWICEVNDWLSVESYVPATQVLSTVSAFLQQAENVETNAIAIDGGYSGTLGKTWLGLSVLATLANHALVRDNSMNENPARRRDFK